MRIAARFATALLYGLLPLSGEATAASPAAAGGSNFYCCTDANGKQMCGDILPPACHSRAYREVGSNGLTRRHVDAPPTAEQRRQRAIEEEKQKAEEAALKEKQRKDQALLNTYGSLDDIEAMRERARSDVIKSINAAQSRIGEISKKRKKYQQDAEFYKNKPLPVEVRKGLKDSEAEIKTQESIVEAKKKELAVIEAKYNNDRQHYLELTQRPAPTASR
ncbi:hypothetical protein [Propionivibrio limicola]|uniref:hypothetical protein n=1 Tax=Propionivibrio limicola TaxID=167645 RepID=UPI0012924E2D|nr:hypothetical protein [Propionivibrio limicola]